MGMGNSMGSSPVRRLEAWGEALGATRAGTGLGPMGLGMLSVMLSMRARADQTDAARTLQACGHDSRCVVMD